MVKRIKIFITTFLLSTVLRAGDNTAIIANVPYNGSISRQEVVMYYTLRYKTWLDGNSVTIVVLPENSQEHNDFVREVLGISVNQYRRLLDNSINSGNGGNLVKVNSLPEMIRKVETTPYSLGYINKDFLVLRGSDKNVKILRISD